MPSFIIVEKNGSVKCTTSKTLNVSDLYKKCGFKSNDGFNCAHTWTIEFNEVEYKIQVYGKTNGRAGSENKYEFPPPIDNTLFFGSCAVINMEDDKIVDMNASEFKDIMDHLQGGYSDIDSEETDETEETEDDDPAIPKTKQGYVKDDFVVDLKPDFQREHVWTKEQQIAYLEYRFKGGRSGDTIYFNRYKKIRFKRRRLQKERNR